MRYFLLLYFILYLFPVVTLGEEIKVKVLKVKGSSRLISKEFVEGKFLIYDCENRHFICVDDDGEKLCMKKRGWAFDLKRVEIPCASVKEFKSLKECAQFQTKIIHQRISREFCFSQKIR